ncbi:hypothetical protein [Psychrobacillus sp. OK032]|uniref:hypothetical protein n=1 Tax=Psychrobacillus sp. OK032 TaxID=1884358 RepID=UPI0008B979E3|nr:hypothetical protein [Psychrobacillus sp. OK032]SER87817.1 hypothetical protein SAMN05518872_102460 [Psychrobacillus sp. OK032]
MNFEQISEDMSSRARQYSINSDSHRCFIEEAVGFQEGVTWTLLKLLQLGLLKIETEESK